MKTGIYKFVVKTLAGLEQVLAGELHDLKIGEIEVLRRGVSFSGTLEDMYKVNMHCRTAISVLKQIGAFAFHTREEFYEQMKSIAWEQYFQVSKSLVITSVATRSELFSHTLYLAQLTKDAIADHFREVCGERPTVSKDEADIRISVYVNGDNCIVSLDSSGEPLFKRGYRRQGGEAPLNEVLAAGLILLSGWDKAGAFIDPMCGSGTFSIEAALMARNIAPGSLGRSFSFEHWTDFNAELWSSVVQEARRQIVNNNLNIWASDINPKAVELTRKNIMEAGLLGQIKLQRTDFFRFSPPNAPGWIILNPPYGQRLKYDDLAQYYKRIGDTLKTLYPGYKAGIISSDISSIKSIGLKSLSRTTVFNGALECKFMVFDLFRGTHKDHVVATRPKRKRLDPLSSGPLIAGGDSDL